MNKKSIAVLITCYNRVSKTIACLTALFNQQAFNNESPELYITVFLVDDGSTDGTSQQVMEKFPQVKIICGDGNLYWNRGMHLAWSEAAKQGFDYYLWLNDDTVLYPDALGNMFKYALQTESKSIICGSTCSSKSGSATYGGRNVKGGLIIPGGSLKPCDFFNGNCVLIPAAVYNKVGNLDYTFHHSLGDLDYGKRAAKLGFSAFVCPAFIGTCEKHDSLPKWCSPSIKLKDRIKAFRTPLAVSPTQHFIYEYRHDGFITALKHFITIYLRLFFPVLWTKKTKYQS